MASPIQWYVGNCVKKDLLAHVMVRAMRTELGWDNVPSLKQFFGKTGEVEVKASDKKPIRVGDWVAFQLAPKTRGSGWRAARYNRLAHLDRSIRFESTSEAKHVLLSMGLTGQKASGTWVFCLNDDEVIQVELSAHADAKVHASTSSRVLVHRKSEKSVVTLSTSDGTLEFYRIDDDETTPQKLDWTTDDQFLTRVIRSLSISNDKRVQLVQSALERYVKDASALLKLNDSDLSATQELLRTGKLAKRLEENLSLLRELGTSIGADVRIKGALEAQAIEGLTAEIAERRRQAETEIEQKKEAWLENGRREVNEKLSAIEEEGKEKIEGELAQFRREQLSEIKESVDRAHADAKSEKEKIHISHSEQQTRLAEEQVRAREQLAEVIAELEVANEKLAKTLEEEALSKEKLDSLRKNSETLSIEKAASIPRLAHTHPSRVAPPLRVTDVLGTVTAATLLSPTGKQRMIDFIALLLAGDVPVLHGPQVEEFLLVAERLISAGQAERLEADPTIITYEDLWIRAGTQLNTPLARALYLSDGDRPRTMLCVIQRAQQSAAKFWYPQLANYARRETFPKNFLVCITAGNLQADQIELGAGTPILLEMANVLVDNAAEMASMPPEPEDKFELDALSFQPSPIKGIRAIAPLVRTMSVLHAVRATRACSYAFEIGGTSAANRVAKLFSQPITANSSGAKDA